MQETLVTLHSVLRWFVLLAAVASLALGALSAFSGRKWDTVSDRTSLILVVMLDLQVLLGTITWLVEQRWAIGDFVTWGHPLIMIAAVGIAHVGRERIAAAQSDRERGLRALFFFGVSLLIVLAAIPTYSWPL